MIHDVRPQEVDSMGEWFMDLLMRSARDDFRVTGIRLKTRGYLWLAWWARIDDPSEPIRVTPPRFSEGFGSFQDAVSRRKIIWPEVRVGHTFTIHGPLGPVVVSEDTEANE